MNVDVDGVWERARGVVAQMSDAELVACLDGDTPFWPGLMDMVAGGYHSHPWPAAQNDRLGLQGFHFVDGPRGCVVGDATAFPVPMARGASFDPDLEAEIGRVIGTELAAIGANLTGAVCMNLLRHPGWGRAQETYGEDPLHVGNMAAALVVGLQEHVMACAKHFALNSMENARFKVDVSVDERPLHEVYLPHFKRVAEAGVASFMSAYNSVNGEWCAENATLLTDILRNEWGWDGTVISDFVYGLRDPIASVHAGLDIEMPFMQQRHVAFTDGISDPSLRSAVIERVEAIVRTQLRFAHLGPHDVNPDVLGCEAHRALARKSAAASMVMLRNDGALPIGAGAPVAVFGRLADIENLGDGGSSDVYSSRVVTPLQGLVARFGDRVQHLGVDPTSAAAVAASANEQTTAVVVVGYTRADEGEFLDPSSLLALSSLFPPQDDPLVGSGAELPAFVRTDPPQVVRNLGEDAGGDRRSLALPADDLRLIEAVSAAFPKTVVVVVAGSAVMMDWAPSVSAVVMAWYSGVEGGHGLADVLSGDVEPSGRLPFAIPSSESHLVDFDPDASKATYDLLHGQWKLDADGVGAAYPFGWGLGFGTCQVESAVVDDSGADAGRLSVAVVVTNTSHRRTSTVVQVYGEKLGSAFERPPRRLIGFAKVSIEAGESRDDHIVIDLAQLDVRSDGGWIRESGDYRLWVAQFAGDPAAIACPISI